LPKFFEFQARILLFFHLDFQFVNSFGVLFRYVAESRLHIIIFVVLS